MAGEMQEYQGVIHLSIRAYYEDGKFSQYYRDTLLSDLPLWLEAHTYTHPNVAGYTIQLLRKTPTDE